MSLIIGWKRLEGVTKIHQGELRRLMAYHDFPKPIPVRTLKARGPRSAWLREEVESWLRQRGFDQ